jgi:hypothetical protein
MRKQQLAAHALLVALTIGLGTARAEGPGGPPPGKGKPADAGPNKPGAGKGDHGKPDSDPTLGKAEPGRPDKPGKADEQHEGERDKDKDKPEKAEHGADHGMRGLLGELKAGKLKKADVKDRLAKLKDKRDERTREHREQLKQRFGNALGMPAAREELQHHARRTARLDRALLLCETENVKDKDKLKERIQKLIDKENARHEQAMARLKSMPSTPAASAAAAAPPSPATSVAAEKGIQK